MEPDFAIKLCLDLAKEVGVSFAVEAEWWFNERDGQDLTPYLPVFEDVTFEASTGE